jgi:acetolactate synthase I/II/III large subunit
MTETVSRDPTTIGAVRMKRTTVAEVIAEELAALDVDRVFGVPGGEVLFLIDALRRQGIEYAVCRHEADAGITAAIYGKLRGTTGVVLTTLGPGAANLMFPLSSSRLDREPLLAISAATPDSWSADRTHQKLPLLEAYGPLTKVAGALTPFNCRSLLRNAAGATITEPAGPAFLTLSADHAVAIAEDQSPNHRNEAGCDPMPVGSARDVAEELRRLLSVASRPIVVAGAGVRPVNADALRSWLDRWQLPVAVTPKVKGIVDEAAPNFVGTVGGMAIDRVLLDALAGSDLVVGFGLDPVEIDGAWHTERPMAWLLESAWATGVLPVTGLLAADHGELLDHLDGDPPRVWVDAFGPARRERAEIYASGSGTGGRLSPVATVRALATVMPPETIVATDVGSHKYVFGQFWPSRQPATFFMSNGLSGMGYGLPAAIGAKLARPDSPVLAVLGDGGFSMNSQELETANRLGARFVTVVLADRSYSLIQIGQANRGLERYGVDFDPIDSVKTAEACGVEGVRVTTEEELTVRVVAALEAGTSLLVEVPIDAADYQGIV